MSAIQLGGNIYDCCLDAHKVFCEISIDCFPCVVCIVTYVWVG